VTPDCIDEQYRNFESSILSPSLREVAQHWRDLCSSGSLPGWADIRPSAIKKRLPIIWYYDYDVPSDDFVGRLAGSDITQMSNKPFKGAKLSELRPSDKYPRSLARAKRVISQPALYRGYGVVYKTDERLAVGERIVMPMAAKGTTPAGIFGATAFKSMSEWAGTLHPEEEHEAWFSLAI